MAFILLFSISMAYETLEKKTQSLARKFKTLNFRTRIVSHQSCYSNLIKKYSSISIAAIYLIRTIMEERSGGKGRRNKRLKLEDKADRISDLPDHLLHHILSFLPSTKEAVQTAILSKRWRNQWASVPVLIFISPGSIFDKYDERFIRFIDDVLLQHDCSKVKKLHLAYEFTGDSNFSEKIRFAMKKQVEELILRGCYFSSHNADWSPEFVFDMASLVKLELIDCDFMDDKLINWGSLKALKLEGPSCDLLNANLLSASSSLELLDVNPNGGYGHVIASKSLKTLILSEFDADHDGGIKISCPTLEQLSFKSSSLAPKLVENVVSSCLLLRKLELDDCYLEKLVIASKSLKKLVLRDLNKSCAIVISCPNLEELNCYGPQYAPFELMNTPRLIYAALNFEISQYGGCHEDKATQIFEQLQNVKELTLGSCFIKILSDAEMGGLSYLWVNNKILTLNGPNFEHLPQIVCALRTSPMLERLVIKLRVYEHQMTEDLLDLDDSGENYWNSNRTDVNCLLHLKTVEIIGLSKQDATLKSVLNFVEFLLKNARVLEKLVLVIISKDQGKDFAFTVSQKVSSFPRCSQHAIVKLSCSNK